MIPSPPGPGFVTLEAKKPKTYGSLLALQQVTRMATYITDVPALAPLISGEDLEKHPAPAIKKGDPIHVDHLLASKRQLELRETIAFTLPQRITKEEVVAAERRHHIIKSLHFDVMDGEHVPRWARQLMEKMDELRDEFREMRDEFRESQRRTDQAVQRSMNRGLKSCDQALEQVIRLVDGTAPQDFPATLSHIFRTDEATIDRWLLFYGMPCDGARITKEKRLAKVLGIDL